MLSEASNPPTLSSLPSPPAHLLCTLSDPKFQTRLGISSQVAASSSIHYISPEGQTAARIAYRASSIDPIHRQLLHWHLANLSLDSKRLSEPSPLKEQHIYIMGVTKEISKQGNGQDYPKKGDDVTIEYTGNLYDESEANNHYRGSQ